MSLIEGLRGSPGLLLFATTLLGLLVGSFLNVVILRLPRMMEQAWRREARELLELPPEDRPAVSLLRPPSACPHCGMRLKPWHNVPVLSWAVLRGRCAGCSARISPQYPLVELAAAGLAAVCALRFGWSPQLLAALVFSWALLTLAVIDLRTTLLPDDLTLPLLWLGLGLSLVPLFAAPQAAIVGAMVGYLALWSVFWLFKLVTGKEGMGYGDFKLLAAIGAWLGWQTLPMVILLSSLVGAVVGIGMILFLRHDRRMPIPFGPYLAAAGWLALVAGDGLQDLYLRSAGLG